MLTLKLAFRSFIRHRWRSALTAAAVALGLSMLLVFVGLADDAHARMAELGIRMGSGNVLVEHAGYRDNRTLDYVLQDADQLAAQVAREPGVEHVAVRLRTSGLLSAGEHSAPVMVTGVDPKLERQASDLSGGRMLVAGQYLRSASERKQAATLPDIYLGQKLAGQLGVGLGERVVLSVSPPGGAEPASAAFRVRGLFRTGVDDLDGGYAQIPISDARKLLKLPGAATDVAALCPLDRSDALAAQLSQRFAQNPELRVVPWQVALRELHEALVLDSAGLYLMMAIVFLVVAIGIFNTVLMSVSERTRELGVMMALGTSAGRLFAQILCEAVVLAVVSLVLGLGVGLGLHFWIATHGIDLSAWTGEMNFAGVAWSGRVYSHLTLPTVVDWTLGVAALVLLSSLFPALRVTRLTPVEAMRHV